MLQSLPVMNNLKDKENHLVEVLKLVWAGVYCQSTSSSIRDKQHNLTENTEKVAIPTVQQRLKNSSSGLMKQDKG